MADRSGKGGGPTAPTAPLPAKETGKVFEVKETQASAPVERVSSDALEQLKAGKIDFDGYLDSKVKEATAHVEGLAPAQLDSIRSMLRARMATDPELVDLIQQATGHAPSVPEE